MNWNCRTFCGAAMVADLYRQRRRKPTAKPGFCVRQTGPQIQIGAKRRFRQNRSRITKPGKTAIPARHAEHDRSGIGSKIGGDPRKANPCRVFSCKLTWSAGDHLGGPDRPANHARADLKRQEKSRCKKASPCRHVGRTFLHHRSTRLERLHRLARRDVTGDKERTARNCFRKDSSVDACFAITGPTMNEF